MPQCSASLFLSALTSVTSSHYTGRHLRPTMSAGKCEACSSSCLLHHPGLPHALTWALGSSIISFIGGLILTQPVMSLVAHMLVRVDRVREWITPAEASQCRKRLWPWCLFVRGEILLTPDGGWFGVVCGWCYRTVLLYWFFPTASPWRGCTLPLFMRAAELHANYFMFPWGREKESHSKRHQHQKRIIKSSVCYAERSTQQMKNILWDPFITI